MRVAKINGFYVVAGKVSLFELTPLELFEKMDNLSENMQFFDPDVFLGWDIFDAAVFNAVLAYGTQKQKARTLANEVLLRLAATTQVEKAFKLIGLKPGMKEVMFFVITNDLDTSMKIAEDFLAKTKSQETPVMGEIDESQISKAVEIYGLNPELVGKIQAKNKVDAVKLLIMQRMASTFL